ncbi:MAG: 4-alpha-glucanotransferase, partial [Clostridia bacterium]|nr:4-alpha-glucanotransferase [Clostridia bacterium]
IDHFRGLESYFSIPAKEKTARNGVWKKGPGMSLIRALKPICEDKLIIAEDLGDITPAVKKLVDDSGYPGMRVLSFGFDGSPACPHVPSAYPTHCIAYTGTHDNEPLRAFIENFPDREWIVSVLKRECEPYFPLPEDHSPRALTLSAVRLLYASKANICILPLWDALALGAEARINFPSTVSPANWSYRFTGEDFTQELSIFLRDLASRYKRL